MTEYAVGSGISGGKSPRRRGAGCVGVACEHTLGRQPLHLYGYLWAKPELTNEQCGRFSFVLPDTVLFKHQKPVRWFFTSKQEQGKILSKSKKHASVTDVLQSFLEPKLQATPRSHRKSIDAEEQILATFTYMERSSSSGELVMVIEHLNRQGVHHLLTNREKPMLSVLQRFVPTRSGYNHLIQSVFTPDSCLIRKSVNSIAMDDTSAPMAQRVATFEGDEKNIRPRDVTSRELRDRIELFNLETSRHLEKIVGKPVERNVSYFKVGSDNRIYFLWCSMLSFESGPRAFAKNHRLSLSINDRIALFATKEEPSTNRSDPPATLHHSLTRQCPNCRLSLPRDNVDFLVTFKAIIKHHESNATDTQLQLENTIPTVLAELLAPLQLDRFKSMKEDTSFLYRTLSVCRTCAHTINTRRHVSTQEFRREQPTIVKQKTEQQLPIYMQSAHSIFWGKAERNETHRTQSRPLSAGTGSSRFRENYLHRSQRSARRNALPGINGSSLKSDTQPEVIVHESPKHCLMKLAEHLQQNYGGPSVRLALTRANIFPPSSLVSLEALHWICDPKLLADVFNYWTEFCKIHNAAATPSAIDMDALDAMLSVHVVRKQTKPDPTLELKHRAEVTPMQCVMEVATRLTKRVPERPKSCIPASASMRAAKLMQHFRHTKQLHASDSGECTNANQGKATGHGIGTNIVAMAKPHVVNRVIDGTTYHVEIVVARDAADGMLSLEVRAREAQSENPAMEATNMVLLLRTSQILELLGHSPAHELENNQPAVPSTPDALIDVVINNLRVVDGRLVLLPQGPPAPLESARFHKSPPITAPIVAATEQLTAEELAVLEAVLRTQPHLE